MTEDVKSLKLLLLRDLPLEGIGPVLRDQVRRAARESDPVRLRQVARSVVAELLRRGDLVRVAVDGSGHPARPLCLVRSTGRLVSLGPLAMRPQVSCQVPSPPTVPEPPANSSHAPLDGVGSLLLAMEAAQDLGVGDPGSGIAEVVLANILDLLGRHLAEVRLALMVERIEPSRGGSGRVVGCDADGERPFWLAGRAPGTALILPGPAEVPAAVREALALDSETAAIAVVPLIEPVEITGDAGAAPREKGLLFVAAPAAWSAAEAVDLAQRLAGFVTRRWRQQWHVNRQIHTDSLTGVHNRAYFDSQFAIELERARRGNSPLALVVSDLDWFKRVNDTHGHHAGDLLLQEVARTLQAALRRIDHICRIGGEEFALILPYTSAAEAQDVLARLLSRPFTLAQPAVAVTMSYGVVTFPDGGADPFELYRMADAMLYLSKERGRNQCHVWRSDEPPLLLQAQRATG